ncbi:ATP-binding cassette domain-containing protein [Vibrio metschnikovii]|uniref:ATP-binding cassette domain-containing protein n=1 Tax=Vibrio metschnikovii TaxID=28172 RepID=UPI002FC65B51|nr:ATP-binding cassette domain-containing protein [Vibrio metschnikovii]
MSFYLKNLTLHKPDGQPLLSHFDLTIHRGEIVSLMGPSGCGKSTLLNVIAGHLPTDFRYRGEMTFNQQDLTTLRPHQRQIGLLFQDDLLFPHLNVWENLAFALPNTVKGQHRKRQAQQALENVSLLALAESFPDQLSGGQRARVSLLRMLLAQPRLALLDEPFSKLDKTLRIQFRQWVFEQLKASQIPTLMVTHDEEDVLHCDRVIQWPEEQLNA